MHRWVAAVADGRLGATFIVYPNGRRCYLFAEMEGNSFFVVVHTPNFVQFLVFFLD